MKNQTASFFLTVPGETSRSPGVPWDIGCILLLLVGCNLGLVRGLPSTALIFDPSAVAAGEWWRLLTWPLVHVSGYHLLLDGSAFLLLYGGLREASPWRRLALAAACAAGSLLLPWLLAPAALAHGLAGLSGVCHGLLAVLALEMACGRPTGSSCRGIGALLVVSVIVKCGWELASGTVLFSALHLGDVGIPVVACHGGGVLGGMGGYFLLAKKGEES